MTVEPGQTIGIVGESGAGKSTLALMVAGLIAPTSGSLSIDNELLGKIDRKRLSRKLQLIWQDTSGSLDPLLTVGASVAEPLKIHGLAIGNETRIHVGNLFREVGLNENLIDRYPHQLSGGELQRVVIARALTTNPQLLICDEPASALDVRIKAQIADLLIKLQSARGLAYVIIAHDLMLVRKVTDYIMVMYSGMVVEQGATREVLDHPLHPYSKLLVGSDPALWLTDRNHEAGLKTSVAAGSMIIDSGCPYYPRCQIAIDRCRQLRPRLLRLKKGRAIACLLPDK
jgi:peptide/nickel transport system ATP-binding protein